LKKLAEEKRYIPRFVPAQEYGCILTQVSFMCDNNLLLTLLNLPCTWHNHLSCTTKCYQLKVRHGIGISKRNSQYLTISSGQWVPQGYWHWPDWYEYVN
jgi:hypothetical protein